MTSKPPIGRPFQPGNQAAVGHGPPMKHGLRPKPNRAVVGNLPKGCSNIRANVAKFRSLTLDTHGAVGWKEALFIQSACRHEQAAMLAQRWLRLECKNMSHTERLQYMTAIANESDKRDKCIERLKLDTDAKTVIETLYSAQAMPEPEAESEDDGKAD